MQPYARINRTNLQTVTLKVLFEHVHRPTKFTHIGSTYSLRQQNKGRPDVGRDFIKKEVVQPCAIFGHFCPGAQFTQRLVPIHLL
jgi:hypothetical protein